MHVSVRAYVHCRIHTNPSDDEGKLAYANQDRSGIPRNSVVCCGKFRSENLNRPRREHMFVCQKSCACSERNSESALIGLVLPGTWHTTRLHANGQKCKLRA